MLMAKTNTDEPPKTTMVRFLQGLRREIAHKVELTQYGDLTSMVHMAEVNSLIALPFIECKAGQP